METTSLPAGAATTGFGGAAATTPTPSDPAIASDFETFLRMLTVQLENQDPLNPQKAEDFAVQLATFSSVEQAVYTNQLLEDLMGQMSLSGVSDLAGWIGKEARAEVPAPFDGETPIEVFVTPAADAEEAVLVVRNSDGVEVDRMPIAITDEKVTWDGATASGFPANPGDYSFSVENFSEGNLPVVTQAEVYGKVLEARVENGTPMLAIAGGGLVAAEAVSALRDASGSVVAPL